MDRIVELRTAKGKAVADARAVIEAAQKENRSTLNAEENTKYEAFINDATTLGVEIEREERQRKLEAESRAIATDLEAARGGKPAESEADDLPEGYKEHRSSVRASKPYVQSFRSYLRRGSMQLGVEEQRSLQAANDTLGGALVMPMQFVARLIKAVDDMVFVRTLAQKVSVVTSQSLGMPTLATDLTDATWTTELLTGSEDDMRFGGRELKPSPIAKLVKVSNKLLAQAALDPEGLVNSRAAYKFGVTEEKAFMTGTGVDQPLGVFVASALGISTGRDVVDTNTSSAPTASGLISAKYALKGAYHSGARWMFHRDCLAKIAKLTDGVGQYLWRESLRVGEPDTLVGFPIDMSEFAPNTFTASQYVGILANWGQGYMIADALDVTVQRLVELYAATNQVGFIFRKETDGMPILEEAFVRVKLGA